MPVLPAEVSVRYAEFLVQKGVAQIYVNKCQRWLRYYLDLCEKYQRETATSRGLDAFLVKLTGKKQNIAIRQEPKRAIQLYQEFLIANRSDNNRSKRPDKGERVSVVGKKTIKRTNGGRTKPVKIVTSPPAANETEAFLQNNIGKSKQICSTRRYNQLRWSCGVEANIFETAGHTPYNGTVFIEPDGVLYCGDCIVKEYIPNLEAGNQQDWISWLQAIDTIEILNPDAIVPGHGDIIAGRSNIKVELDRIRSILHTALKESKAPAL